MSAPEMALYKDYDDYDYIDCVDEDYDKDDYKLK